VDTATGIIIRRHPLTETSWIIGWCTTEHGLLSTVAKGGRSQRGPFAGKLDLFYSAEFTFARSRKSDLHTLTEVRLLTPRTALQSSYVRLLAAAYFVHLLELVTEKETPSPEAYDLLHRSLGWLERQEPDLRGVLHFERELTISHGLTPPDATSAIQIIRETWQTIPASRAPLLAALRQ
jgi:DNA repair protein RecO (recombination protein O)